MQEAYKKHRKAIESSYTGICDIYEKGSVTDKVTKITKQEEVLVLARQPCRISFSSVSAAAEAQNAVIAGQVVKLFLAPEVEVKPGAKIVITQNGRVGEYCRSGIPAVYPSHQEVNLELFGGYA